MIHGLSSSSVSPTSFVLHLHLLFFINIFPFIDHLFTLSMSLVPNDSPAPAVKPHYSEPLQAYVDGVADSNAAVLDNVQLWWTIHTSE